MIESIFFDLVENLADVKSRADGNRALRQLTQEYGLTHATYLGINIPTLTDRTTPEQSIYFVTTYADAWCEHYVKSGYVQIDPIIRNGMAGILPFDWKDLPQETPVQRRFFGEAHEHGIGLNGLSFPIRGAHGETALFSINSAARDEEWAKLKRQCARDFQVLAYHFHTQILEAEGVRFNDPALSRREIECLKWAAAGKTQWETGIIMHISAETVKYYLENARVKLGTINTVQAVTKAIAARLI